MFDTIERLKAEWTDKYVVIESSALTQNQAEG